MYPEISNFLTKCFSFIFALIISFVCTILFTSGILCSTVLRAAVVANPFLLSSLTSISVI